MSEEPIEEVVLVPLTDTVPEVPPTPVIIRPYFKNRYFTYDHMNNQRRTSKMFLSLGENELLQIYSALIDRIGEITEIAKFNGIQLTRYEPQSSDPYYYLRNAYVCKKIPIESIEKYKGIHFDPSNLVE